MKPISNPPNPWRSTSVEWLEAPPEAHLEVFEEEVKSVVSENDSPDVGFRFSLNPYRGCAHACSYCLAGDTPVLLADGSTRPIADLRVGDEVVGTVRGPDGRRCVATRVHAHWCVVRRAHRVVFADGTSIDASAGHRLLTTRGWRRVAASARSRFPALSPGDGLVGVRAGVLPGVLAAAFAQVLADPAGSEPARDTAAARVRIDPGRRVVAVEPAGAPRRLFDVTTGTGDFVANGVVSHNCYARPSHQYLGFGAGTDFERKIVVKVNAPEALRRELERPSWKGETLVFSGNTDCYQPLEASYGLTRRCLEVCLEYRQPVSLITKGVLVRRDLDVWGRLARGARASAHVSVPFLDPVVAKGIEPGVAAPARRFEAMKALADAGVEVGISLAPVVPGLNDADIPELLERARDAGATSAFLTLVRLPAEVLPVFTERIEAAFPGRARKVLSQIREVRGGRMYDSRWGSRMKGDGPRWDVVRSLFDLHCRRLGLNRADDREGDRADAATTFRRPPKPGEQATLFDVEEGGDVRANGRPRGGEPMS